MTRPPCRRSHPSRRRATWRRGLAALVPAALLAALLTGCAGGGDATSHPSTSTTRKAPMTHATDLDQLAADAYVWGYPLVVTQRTLQSFAGLIGVNRLFWQRQLSDAATRVVVAPNRDTLYSIAVLDLRAEPQVLTVPEVTDRYWAYQFLDAYTESFAYLGTRATGGRAGTYAVTGPGWSGDLPSDVERIEADTPLVFLLGRFRVDGPDDVADVTALAPEVQLRPLSAVTGAEAPPPPPALGSPPGAPQSVADAGASFYDELGDALAVSPPTTADGKAALARFTALGVGPGEHPATDGSPEVRAALAGGADAGERTIGDSMAEHLPLEDGWRLSLQLGTYGDRYDVRAAVARAGWGANVAEEAVYPVATTDGAGRPLTGDHRYRLHFAPGELPPVDAFWSLTLYGPDLFFVPNDADRFHLGDRSPGLVTNPDGSLDLLIQHDPPPGHEANWLPAPASGRFSLMLRLYLPSASLLAGRWSPPGITRLG